MSDWRRLVESWDDGTCAYLRAQTKSVRDGEGGEWAHTSREVPVTTKEWRERMIEVLERKAA